MEAHRELKGSEPGMSSPSLPVLASLAMLGSQIGLLLAGGACAAYVAGSFIRAVFFPRRNRRVR
jgi:hypothetical protein